MPHWTPEAISDIRQTWDYIAADSEAAADRTIALITSAGDRLDTFPRIGRPGLEPGTRELVVVRTQYRLVYQLTEAT
jgi:plasmid stabilization system protein ParE